MRELRRQNVWINNESLRDVDPRIINVRVVEPDAQEAVSYAANPGRPGQRVLDRQRRSKKITVQFAVRELYNPATRTTVLDAVNRWARDGALQASTRPERMAQVIVTKWASAADIAEYTGVYSVEFEAAGIPYWQDETPARLALSGTSASGQIVVHGSAETALEAVVTPTGTLDELTIDAAGADGATSVMAFTGLGATGALSLSIDARGLLQMTPGMAAHRTPESDDMLFVSPGLATVTLTADVSCAGIITARGRWR